uniref:Putative RNB-like protein n=1 Tax=uncultured marine microorganism HF4000_APKG3D20 TaxID=455549 RepID=B3T7C1_9ZZZZ|nr:putative RNB-like protein [uncultured marine microorganism HF4000_APKG3D20]
MGKSNTRGVLVFRRNGNAFVEIRNRQKSFQLAKAATACALHGDEVEIRQVSPRKRKPGQRKATGRRSYEVVKVVSRSLDHFLGFAQRQGKGWMIRPEDRRLHTNFALSGEMPPNLVDGEKVLVQFVDWGQPQSLPRGRILRVLGPAGDPMTDHIGILAKYKLPNRFSRKVESELNTIPRQVRQQDLKGRKDLRDRFTLTVDPIDARDFDDALSLHPLKGGNVEVGVHIADVSAYVAPESAIDKEARRRGNSTYLVGEVVPMLPKQLSNGICSLVEAEDRLVKSVLFTFDPKGNVLGHHVTEAVIRSDKRLTYEQAKLLMDESDLSKVRSAKPPESRYSGKPGTTLSKLPDGKLLKLQSTLRNLWSFADELREQRLRHGALDLGGKEVKILVDDRGNPERMMRLVNDESHQLIEEFMLLANETVAKELRRLRRPAIHRVHDDPDPEKLDELRSFAAIFGISCGDLNHRKAMTALTSKIKNHPISQVLRIKLLRSLRKACYRVSPDGHYGLAKSDYLHFTSPIRRYADLVVHRIIEAQLRGSRTTAHSRGDLEKIAFHVSETERNSVDAERESVKTKLVAYYARELKENNVRPHEAIITQIGRRGFFVELTDTLAQGFVALRALPRHEGYRVSANETAITARNPKKTLKIGQRIKVMIDRVDQDEKLLDFRLA